MTGGVDPELRDLFLRDFVPHPALRIEEHVVPAARFPAVDAHHHAGRWLTGDWLAPDVDALLRLMDAANVSAIVNLDGRWDAELEANLDRYDRAHPGRFVTFCHLDWREAAAGPGFGDRLAGSLRRAVETGARGVKVWKDLGLHVRDHDGELLMPDDDRLGPVFDAAAALEVPILIHTADPVAFFEPVDRFNERLEELLENPDWSFADPSFPRFDELMASLEALVAAHPRTTFIGAHVGCNAENLAWVDRMFDTYPNFHADIGARIAELGRQPRSARELIVKHPDRVLFGTDEYPASARTYAVHFRFLETEDEHFAYSVEEPPPQGRWAISGLGLDDEVLRQLYAGNARRLIPGLA